MSTEYSESALTLLCDSLFSDILYSAFKSHLAFKAYLFLKHKALESFSPLIHMYNIVLFGGTIPGYGLFPT